MKRKRARPANCGWVAGEENARLCQEVSLGSGNPHREVGVASWVHHNKLVPGTGHKRKELPNRVDLGWGSMLMGKARLGLSGVEGSNIGSGRAGDIAVSSR